MTKVVYTSASQSSLRGLLSPFVIAKHLWRHRELIRSQARREFEATYRANVLGLAWTVLTPLIMLLLFTFVFGYVFKGRFNPNTPETPAEFAVALFVGLSLYQVIGNTLTGSCGLMLANTVYIKSLSFPVEVLGVSFVLNQLFNLAIAVGLCLISSLIIHGMLPLSTLAVLVHVACLALMALGLTWFLSAISVFVRDVPSLMSPVAMMLMFLSSVFFPVSSVSPRVQWLFAFNPLAVLIEQARGAILYGRWPDIVPLAVLVVISLAIAIGGYGFFMRSKPAFADVL